MKDFIPVRIEDWDEGISLVEWYDRAEREYSDYIAFDYTRERLNWVDDAPEMHRRENPLWNRESNMKISNAFPSKYLKCADLQGKSVTVKIERVEMEQIGEDHRPVAYFYGKEKGFVLNKTNGSTISDMYGDDTDGWDGKEITLRPTRVDFRGERVDAIRVEYHDQPKRNGAPKIKPKMAFDDRNPPPDDKVPDDMNDEVPF